MSARCTGADIAADGFTAGRTGRGCSRRDVRV